MVIGASLSKPYTSGETGHIFCVNLYIYRTYVRRPVYSRFACSNLTICNVLVRIIGASLSEPHTSGETGRIFCVYLYIYLSYIRRPVYSRFACSNLTICNVLVRIIGASLSKPHTSGETGHIFCVYLYIYLSYVRRPVYSRFACSNLTICNVSLPRVDLQYFVYSCVLKSKDN